MAGIFHGRASLTHRNKPRNSAGFTLIEIIIAVMILAVSLTTLLGLQSSATQTAIQTRNKQEAILTSRAIMSAIEYAGGVIKNQSTKGSASDVALRFLSQEATAPIVAQEKRIPLTAALTIEDWPMEGLPANSLKKVTLTIGWGPKPEDSVTTYYFVAAKIPDKDHA